MNIILNGKQLETESQTLQKLIHELDFQEDSLIVEFNRELVKKEHWPNTLLNDGDSLELLNFVGGG